MSDAYDVIVIGVGTMGAAACDALARRGVRVLGLEQFDVPHAMGSHHGQSRMFRMAYFEHPDYVPLLKRAFELWQELEQRAAAKLFYVTGGVYMGPEEGELVRGSIEAAQRHGLEHEVLDRSGLRERWPQFVVPEGWQAFWEPSAGFVVPELAVGTMARLAMECGAEIHGREGVRAWRRAGHGYEVETERGTYRAKRLLVTCGAWTARTVRELGVELVVTRQVLAWVWPQGNGATERYGLGAFPCWAAETEGGVDYGFPMLPWHPGLKAARHVKGRVTEPDSVDRRVTAEDEAEARRAFVHLEDAEGPLLSSAACLYTNSPDSHFIIDRHPSDDGVTIGCGFSGHGFKFAPVIGEVLADLALDGRSRHRVEFLGLHRFAR
jgi:sarcosine oxidase